MSHSTDRLAVLMRIARRLPGRKQRLMPGLDSTIWLEYERRKQEISRTAKTGEEYHQRIKDLCKELGL